MNFLVSLWVWGSGFMGVYVYFGYMKSTWLPNKGCRLVQHFEVRKLIFMLDWKWQSPMWIRHVTIYFKKQVFYVKPDKHFGFFHNLVRSSLWVWSDPPLCTALPQARSWVCNSDVNGINAIVIHFVFQNRKSESPLTNVRLVTICFSWRFKADELLEFEKSLVGVQDFRSIYPSVKRNLWNILQINEEELNDHNHAWTRKH